jgi:GNAT superfamily N-acetyltransferase
MSRVGLTLETVMEVNGDLGVINVVAVRDGRRVGGAFIAYDRSGRGSSAELVTLRVLDDDRRLGVGRAVLEKAEQLAVENGVVEVETWMADPETLDPFLRRMGWEVTSKRDARKSLRKTE